MVGVGIEGLSVEEVFADGGELGRRMQAIDWSRTPLGPVEHWPQSLRTCVRVMLTASAPMYVWWGEHLINLYNDAFVEILGGKHPDALGQPAEHVWHEIWDAIGLRATQAMRENRGTYDRALLLVMERNGYREETYYTCSYSPVPDDHGDPGGILCTKHSDTLRIFGERQLALLAEVASHTADAHTVTEACERAAMAMATNPRDVPFALIYTVDATGRGARLAATVGIPRDHHLVSESIPNGGESPWPIEAVLRTGEMQAASLLGVDDLPHGVWRDPPTEALALPIRARDTLSGILVLGRNPYRLLDANYRQFLELLTGQIGTAMARACAMDEERRRAEALAEVDRAKTAFFSNVSHEFRTPLTLMLGPTEDALRGDVPLEGASLATVYRNQLRLLRLVNSLLDFSRIEAGRMRAWYQPADLAALTTDLASLFRAAVERAGVAFEIDAQPIGEPVYVDPRLYETIVLNLVSNAFKFTLEGTIRVSLAREDDAAVLRVADTGVGISAEHLPHIFERFHRVENARARTHEGSGIGLAMVQELVRLHGGSIDATSVEGKGTEMVVRIPLGMRHLPADRLERTAEESSPSMASAAFFEEAQRWVPDEPAQRERVAPAARVLIVDDNADMRDYLRRVLETHWEVDVAKDGVEALDRIKDAPPDLVIADAMMPRLDGFGLIQAMRRDPATRALPVVVLSARAEEQARIEGFELGADDYLIKPFSARELVARVRVHLELSLARRRAERDRERLYALLAQLPAFVTVWRGPEHILEFYNEPVRELLGGGDLQGLQYRDAVPSSLQHTAILDRVYATGMSAKTYFSITGMFHGREGATRTFDTVWTALRDIEGTIEGVIAFGFDVTESVEARHLAEEAEERLRVALDASDIGTYTWNVDTSQVVHDAGVQQLFEFTNGHSLVDDYTDRVHPDDRDRWARALDRTIAEGVPFECEYRIVRRDGSLRWVHDKGTLRLVGGDRLVSGAIVDITERKLAADRVEHALELAERASRAKDEFMAMLGHELRNPMAPIRTALDLLRLRGERSKELSVIERQVNHLVQLVDDLLDIARITRGKVELRREVVDVHDVVGRAVEISTALMEQRAQVLTVDVPAGPLYVDGDPIRLAQILANLLTNAAKYTQRGGAIKVTAKREDNEAVICVTDNGSGIDPSLLPHVFELFVQGKRSTDRAEGGLGLGLALVHNLVRLHGGRVDARSEGTGKGSTFEVRLPLVQGTAPSPQRTNGVVSQHRRVLLVDDNADAAALLATALEDAGHEVLVVHDGPQALAAIERYVPDVAVLDIGLPVMDGYELLSHLRARPELANTEFIAVTGYGQPSDRERSKRAGFHHHLVKPVELATLLRVIASGR